MLNRHDGGVQAVDLGWCKRAGGAVAELGFDLGGMVEAIDAGGFGGEGAAVAKADGDLLGGVFGAGSGGRAGAVDAGHELADLGVVDAPVADLGEGQLAVDEGDGEEEGQTEAGGDFVGGVEADEGNLVVQVGLDGFDVVGGEAVIAPELEGGLDRLVSRRAGGEALDLEGSQQLPFDAELGQRLFGVRLVDLEGLEQAERRFQDVRVAGEAGRGQHGGLDALAGSVASLEGFSHDAEVAAQTARGGGGDADGAAELGLVEMEDLARGERGGDGADEADVVPAAGGDAATLLAAGIDGPRSGGRRSRRRL